jgi:YVTN family beta-propeller protein
MKTAPFAVFAAAVALSLSACDIETVAETLKVNEPPTPQALVVSLHDSIVSFDVETGEARPGKIEPVGETTDMQALSNGKVLVNLRSENKVLVLDALTMTEEARINNSASSEITRPVHSFVYSEHHKEKYWIATNDSDPVTNSSMTFIDIDPASPTYLKAVGEVALGKGHHKAASSSKAPRIVVSNIADCDNVLSVYDFSDVSNIEKVSTLSALDAGWNADTRVCGKPGVPRPGPHGCGYASATGKAYCNFTGDGTIAGVDLDSAAPSWITMSTGGSGSGYTKVHPGGRYLYSLQSSPREGNPKNPGVDCQIGQLLVIDSQTDKIAKKVPLFYEGPHCTTKLADTDEGAATPFRMRVTQDGKTLFVSLATGKGSETAQVRKHLAFDVSAPESPQQLESIATGASQGHRGDAITGDDRYLFITNNLDGTVTQVDVQTRQVVRTLEVGDMPHWLATYGEKEGASHQVH